MQFRYTVILLLLFWIRFGCAGIRSTVDSINIVRVNSLSQKIVDKNKFFLEGDVDVLLDHKMHIWADIVEIDQENQTVVARAKEFGFVKLEAADFVMLADYVELHLATKTGTARNIKIHFKEGFLSAGTAQKVDEQSWKMDHIRYTSCDKARPHWAFTAHKAILYKNSVLKASGLLFKIQELPVFMFPVLVFPLQNRAGSGFLMPRLSFDAELGFGFKQEYYWLLGNHCDTTLGFNVVQKKGFILSDEFRWAKSPENFLMINSNYAEEWNASLERRGRIISGIAEHYWIQGRYFQPFFMGPIDLQSLIRFDFGTDKRIGYHFLNTAEQVEDSFYNTIIERHTNAKNNFQFMVHSERSLKKQFSEIKNGVEKKKEREEKVSVSYLPQLEWNSAFSKIFPKLFYRHDIVFDQAFLETRNIEKIYVDDLIDQTTITIPQIDAHTARLLYKGRMELSSNVWRQKITLFVEPHFQARTNLKSNYSHGKASTRMGVEWNLPERMLYSDDYRYTHYMQPAIRWSYMPKISQENWYHIDKYDRLYPENVIECILRNNWRLGQCNVDLFVSQGYSFYNKDDIFYLTRCYNQNHMLPLKLFLECAGKYLSFYTKQEYGLQQGALLQAELGTSFSWKSYEAYFGYLYQKEGLQKDRELLSDISSFGFVGCSVPIGKSFCFHYDGNFYSKYKHTLPIFNMMKPTLHRVRLNYKGHCWGVSFGFEEKRYRQYGKWKSEHAFTLAIRLESIGSFAQKFKRPVAYRAPSWYEG